MCYWSRSEAETGRPAEAGSDQRERQPVAQMQEARRRTPEARGLAAASSSAEATEDKGLSSPSGTQRAKEGPERWRRIGA
jgi:hypothetical protein